MSMQAETTSVRTEITVQAPIEQAFSLFTVGMGTDKGVDGSECHWARVLTYEPPNRVVFSWDINPQWQIESDHEKTSEVEVRFTPEGPDRTHVELEHRNLDRHGEGWEQMRDAVGSPNGWNLRGFAEAAKAA